MVVSLGFGTLSTRPWREIGRHSACASELAHAIASHSRAASPITRLGSLSFTPYWCVHFDIPHGRPPGFGGLGLLFRCRDPPLIGCLPALATRNGNTLTVSGAKQTGRASILRNLLLQKQPLSLFHQITTLHQLMRCTALHPPRAMCCIPPSIHLNLQPARHRTQLCAVEPPPFLRI